MSKTARELNYLEDVRADFDEFLRENDWKNARICINDMGDRGEELEALKMHQEYNRAKNFVCLNWNGTCKENHTQACLEWNQTDAGKDEGEISERSLRGDEYE
jgi:hypothetical protein